MARKLPHRRRATSGSDTDWMQKKWRPMMAMLYMAICLGDFIIFPILWTVIQAYFHGGLTSQWQPLTLQGGGLIHIAFGAILGISAYGRTQEKINGVDSSPAMQFPPGAGTTYVPPGMSPQQANQMNSGFGGTQQGGAYTPPSSWGTTPVPVQSLSGFGGVQAGGFGTPTVPTVFTPAPVISNSGDLSVVAPAVVGTIPHHMQSATSVAASKPVPAALPQPML